MDFRTILYEKLGAVLRITTNRPGVLNAQSRVMILELDRAFRMAVEDDDTRVVIVAGAGAHFSAGHDLGIGQRHHHGERRQVGKRQLQVAGRRADPCSAYTRRSSGQERTDYHSTAEDRRQRMGGPGGREAHRIAVSEL